MTVKKGSLDFTEGSPGIFVCQNTCRRRLTGKSFHSCQPNQAHGDGLHIGDRPQRDSQRYHIWETRFGYLFKAQILAHAAGHIQAVAHRRGDHSDAQVHDHNDTDHVGIDAYLLQDRKHDGRKEGDGGDGHIVNGELPCNTRYILPQFRGKYQ